MKRADILAANGYEDVIVFSNYDYDDAIIGVTEDCRVVYDFGLMVKYLIEKEGFTEAEAVEWIQYNTIRDLPYIKNGPIVMYPLCYP